MKLKRIEYLIATGVWIFCLIVLYSQKSRHVEFEVISAKMGYASVIYAGFMAFNGWVCYHYFRHKKTEAGIGLSLLLFFVMWMGLTTCGWLMQRSNETRLWPSFILEGLTLGVSLTSFACFILYEAIKAGVTYLWHQQGTIASRIAKEFLIVLVVGIPIFLLLMLVSPDGAFLWILSTPYAYLVFALNTYWLLPKADSVHQQKLLYGLLGIAGSFLLFIPFGVLFLHFTSSAGFIYFSTWFCINLIIVPLAYYVHSDQQATIAQLINLKSALGKSTADVRFLRSQINPHFLFNILNTLYGIALQEDAERTATSIQKLGDMMRFMLHENHEDKILLAREIEYLRNYIDLQMLRTITSPAIQINCDIHDSMDGIYITPMLLIPFVENAFKHGISFQEKSWIQISLRDEQGRLFFDVHNSLHTKLGSDPERDHKGIGLENVKQRLEWMYPNRHELIIRQTASEFFIHLTVTL